MKIIISGKQGVIEQLLEEVENRYGSMSFSVEYTEQYRVMKRTPGGSNVKVSVVLFTKSYIDFSMFKEKPFNRLQYVFEKVKKEEKKRKIIVKSNTVSMNSFEDEDEVELNDYDDLELYERKITGSVL